MTLLREILDVIVDLREESETFGESCSFNINEKDKFKQIYMPPGIAHGYTFSNHTELNYKVVESIIKVMREVCFGLIVI